MFTGIVEAMGSVEAVERTEAGRRFVLGAEPAFCGALRTGDSVSVNGVCLTVESRADDRFTVTAVGETLARTTMGDLTTGDRVNLEPAATPATALGGHLVQGHVDGVGVVRSFERQGEDRLLTIDMPETIGRFMVSKGSIAVDGVSLTVADIAAENRIVITIIPFTVSHTTIGRYGPGRRVNLEVDIIAKYVSHYVGRFTDRGVHSS